MASPIAVLGGGNGSHAAVADLTEAGHEVRWWRRELSAFGTVAVDRTLTVTDYRGERTVAVNPTSELPEALDGAELIVAPVPAFAQEALAQDLAPALSDGQVLFLPPGTFGSYTMLRTLRTAGCQADVALAETGTLPWLTRKRGEGQIRITTRASRLPTGVFPARSSNHALALISAAFPDAIEPVEDGLSAALMNAGPIIHPPLVLMNAGPIEHFPKWDIHNEGTQPAIRSVHDALDAERIAIRERLGYQAPHFPLSDHYNTSNWMYGHLAHDRLIDSGDWHESLDLGPHRYVSEDIGYGLTLLVTLAEWLEVPCPVAAGLLAIASAASGSAFRETGRTWANLGLASLSEDALRHLLKEGL